MHSYLKAIGFSNIKSRIEAEGLINKVVENASMKTLAKISNKISLVEYSIEYSENIGVSVRGEIDEKGKFYFDHYYPFLYGTNVSTIEELYINKKIDTQAYTGMCDDYRIGVSLIFYLHNVIDLFNFKKKINFPFSVPITLSALSCEGKIILNTYKDEEMIKNYASEVYKKSRLIADAKSGDIEAIENLTMDDIDMYANIARRIQKEDVYTMVESSFIPYGSESDIYSILGTIIDLKEVQNTETKEKLYVMLINCNQIEFEVCINKKNLYGQPSKGRRFRGTVWIQGYVDFLKHS